MLPPALKGQKALDTLKLEHECKTVTHLYSSSQSRPVLYPIPCAAFMRFTAPIAASSWSSLSRGMRWQEKEYGVDTTLT